MWPQIAPSYLAGEHTTKEHPDTVGGAMLTGIREAAHALRLLRDLQAGGDGELGAKKKARRRAGSASEDGERGGRGGWEGAGPGGRDAAARGLAALQRLFGSDQACQIGRCRAPARGPSVALAQARALSALKASCSSLLGGSVALARCCAGSF
jgi:hypothetical protein